MGISVKEHCVELASIGVTFDAIRNLNEAIREYSRPVVGPAYIKFEHTVLENAQIERSIMVTALAAQRQRLIDYLTGIGLDWDIPDTY
jgi:hypothetical protein